MSEQLSRNPFWNIGNQAPPKARLFISGQESLATTVKNQNVPRLREKIYKLKPGETLNQIAQRNLISNAVLVAANPHIKHQPSTGEIILIPLSSEIHNGMATYYSYHPLGDKSKGKLSIGGNCTLDPIPTQYHIAAMNPSDYAGAGICGGYIQVIGPKGVVKAMVVDSCPECPKGCIDLDQKAFAEISDLETGRISIEWRIIPLDFLGNDKIEYYFGPNSDQWFMEIQLRNLRYPLVRLEYWDNKTGEFIPLNRRNDNYFEGKGLGTGPFTLRVTSIYGQQVEDQNIQLRPGQSIIGKSQFPLLHYLPSY
ncbi:MAG TPA: expansin EXLX1 family cellulose-binding protein [Bacillota bacterium]|nr:expansin EXLX1 family cellulose-binding protein [Bacillota bacterium]